MLFEAVVFWLAATATTVAVVVPYLVRFRRRVHGDRERKEEAARLGIDRPAAQYPAIDVTRCIGCGACVAACPEGDVLGVVGGTAVVVNGLRCVGHARCEEACPVGAIEVGLGDLKARKDVPLLAPDFQTSVPGVYVIGELGGLALVRNAVAQGRQVVREIAERAVDERSAGGGGGGGDDPEVLDLAVIGAGPSGLSAGLTAAHAGLSYVVLEREETLGGSLLHYPRRKMVLTQPVDLQPWGSLDREEYAKETLLELFEAMMRDSALAVRFGAAVTAVERRGCHLALSTAGPGGGSTVLARRVVLALGRRGSPRKLGVPGEELPKVMYKLIDAESYRDRHILVVGGGDSAAEAAVGLGLQPGNRVTLSYRREKIVRVKKKNQERLDRAIAEGTVEPLFSSQPLAIEPDHVRLAVDGKGEVEIENDEIFVFAGGVPPFKLLQDLGVAFGGG